MRSYFEFLVLELSGDRKVFFFLIGAELFRHFDITGTVFLESLNQIGPCHGAISLNSTPKLPHPI